MMIVSIKYPTEETGNNVRNVPVTTTTGVVIHYNIVSTIQFQYNNNGIFFTVNNVKEKMYKMRVVLS